MRPLCIAAALFLLGCTEGRPALTDTDTATMGELGRFRIGLRRAEAKRIAREGVPRSERIACKSHPGYEFCSHPRRTTDYEGSYGLLFQKDTLRALTWTRSGDFATLSRRYAHFGEPQRVQTGRSPRPRDVFAEWVNPDSTIVRTAVCHDGRSKPICKVVAAQTTPAQIRKRAATHQDPR